MKRKLENLLEFQKVEIEIERLNAILTSVPATIEALEMKKKSIQASHEQEKEAMSILKKRFRDMESDVQANTARITKSQDKLGAVKTNKEYQAILKEIDDIQELNSGIEDEMLACLEQLETSEADFAAKGDVIVQVIAQISGEIATIKRDAEETANRLGETEKLRHHLFEGVDPSLMTDYRRTQKIVGRHTLVPVLKGICQGCHMNIPPQMYIELQRGGDKLKFCPHCDRIVFWNDMLES